MGACGSNFCLSSQSTGKNMYEERAKGVSICNKHRLGSWRCTFHSDVGPGDSEAAGNRDDSQWMRVSRGLGLGTSRLTGQGIKSWKNDPYTVKSLSTQSRSSQRDAESLPSLWKDQREIREIPFNPILITECPTDQTKGGTNTLVPTWNDFWKVGSDPLSWMIITSYNQWN